MNFHRSELETVLHLGGVRTEQYAMRKLAGIRIRRARLADLETLVNQRRSMFEDIWHLDSRNNKLTGAKYKKWVVEMIKKRRFAGFLAVSERGEPVGGGCVWIREMQPSPWSEGRLRVPYLMSMFTSPQYRGRGIATSIVKEAMGWSKKKGYRTMILHASKLGRPVYSRLGWKRTWEMRVDLTRSFRKNG